MLDKDISINRSIKMWNNLPIDNRLEVESLLKIDDTITYPYQGMIFYSKLEDDFYKVTSIVDGYKNIRTGQIFRTQLPNSIRIKNYFVGTYEQLTLKGNMATSITKAEVRNGYLFITFHNGNEINAGYVQGDDGFSPIISELENNNIDFNEGNLIYQLKVLFQDMNGKKQEFNTPNLIGPYITNIEDIEGGYVKITLSTGNSYNVGPYGIKTMELVGNDLHVFYYNGTETIIENVKGEDGTSIRILGTLESIEKLPNFAKKGDCYIINGDFYQYDEILLNFRNVGRICGYDGKDGETPNLEITSKRIDNRVQVNVNVNDELVQRFYIFDGYSPKIREVQNTIDTYILGITSTDENGDVKEFLTPNLKGENGKDLNIKDSLDSVDDLSIIENPEINDGYLIDGYLWVFNNNTNNTESEKFGFKNVGLIKGPQGDKGENGEKVLLRVNENFIQWKYDTEENWRDLIELLALKGDQGIQGKSAYEVYKDTVPENETPMTREEWLESLKGQSIKINSAEKSNKITTVKFSDGTSIEINDGENGTNGIDGDEIELNVIDNWIQWKYTKATTWHKLIEVNDINGTDGREVQLRVYNNYIQWKYNTDYSWNDLISIETISGENGTNGKSIYVKSQEKVNGVTTLVLSNDEEDTVVKIVDGLNGKSAYEIYKDNTTDNPVMTEKEWLESLKGDSVTITSIEKIDGITTVTFSNGKTIQINDGNSIYVKYHNKNNETGEITLVLSDGETDTNIVINDGKDGKNGKSAYELYTETTTDSNIMTLVEWLESLKGSSITIVSTEKVDGITTVTFSDNTKIQIVDGEKGDSVTITSTEKVDGITTITFSDGTIIEINDGIVGGKGDSITITSTEKVDGVTTVTFSDGTSININDGENGDNGESVTIESINKVDGVTTIKFSDGKSIEINDGENGDSITVDSTTKNDGITTVTFSDGTSININDGENGDSITIESTEKVDGVTTIKFSDGTSIEINDGEKGSDGDSVELRTYDKKIQWKYTLEDDSKWRDLIELEEINGFSPTVSITENPSNDENTYKLDISITNEDGETSFTTPNLKGGVNELYKIIETLPTKDTNNEYDYNHIYMILKAGNTEIVTGQSNYDKYLLIGKDETGNLTWEKVESNEISGNILVFLEEGDLPDVTSASTNFIYCLPTPEYQRGLDIGLSDNAKANKNHFEEWIVIEDGEGNKSWELLAPQIYRISQSMIDYVWEVNKTFTVYDDWDEEIEISDYQESFGDITPIDHFVYKYLSNNEIAIVKYLPENNSDVYLNIAPYYKINGKVYKVTSVDGTYIPDDTYYTTDTETGNEIEYHFDTSQFYYDGNGVEVYQTVFTGPNIKSIYIPDTTEYISRVFIGTSNIGRYHVPASIKIIGDYAYYSSYTSIILFEDEEGNEVGFENSSIEAIGIYACSCASNLSYDDGIVKCPASLKKISNYAFYRTNPIRKIDTTNCTNLYIGKYAFSGTSLSASQVASTTTYYTDYSFFGMTFEIGTGGLFWQDANSTGTKLNGILNVTLDTTDPTFE